jgi:hypothetical protein
VEVYLRKFESLPNKKIMTNSKHIAKLLGPFLIALTISELMNPHIWNTVAVTQIYLAGSLWLLGGLTIIRSHNEWSLNWSVLITIIGWFAILGGLSRMFFPVSTQPEVQHTSAVLVLQIVLLAVGLFLTCKAFWPKH